MPNWHHNAVSHRVPPITYREIESTAVAYRRNILSLLDAGLLGGCMGSQMVASGRIRHENMAPEAMTARVREHFPKLEESDGDFVIPLADCRAVMFCQHNGELFFEVTPLVSGGDNRVVTEIDRVVTEVELLVPSTDSLWEGLRNSLKRGPGKKYPTLTECSIEDRRSKAKLLLRDPISPLRSPGAKIAYSMSLLFCVIGVILVVWQFHMRQSADARTANVLAVALAFGVAAASMPVPILMNWRERKNASAWRYARVK